MLSSRVSATYAYDLEIEEGIYSQDPFFQVSEKLMQMNKNPELFSPFLPFFGLNNLLPLTGMKYFGLQAFRIRAERSYIIRLVNSLSLIQSPSPRDS